VRLRVAGCTAFGPADRFLVRREKDGLWVNYTISGGRSPYAASLLGHLRHWLSEDAEVRLLLENLDSIRREDICKQE
jgi:ArsR family transcriptional regulator